MDGGKKWETRDGYGGDVGYCPRLQERMLLSVRVEQQRCSSGDEAQKYLVARLCGQGTCFGAVGVCQLRAGVAYLLPKILRTNHVSTTPYSEQKATNDFTRNLPRPFQSVLNN